MRRAANSVGTAGFASGARRVALGPTDAAGASIAIATRWRTRSVDRGRRNSIGRGRHCGRSRGGGRRRRIVLRWRLWRTPVSAAERFVFYAIAPGDAFGASAIQHDVRCTELRSFLLEHPICPVALLLAGDRSAELTKRRWIALGDDDVLCVRRGALGRFVAFARRCCHAADEQPSGAPSTTKHMADANFLHAVPQANWSWKVLQKLSRDARASGRRARECEARCARAPQRWGPAMDGTEREQNRCRSCSAAVTS